MDLLLILLIHFYFMPLLYIQNFAHQVDNKIKFVLKIITLVDIKKIK